VIAPLAERPRVSIVTPSLNQGEFIGQAIESVLAQDYPNIEYLVVDGGSQDDTLHILGRYGDRVRWTSGPDAGQADAIRRGFESTSGDIIAWLNADDRYRPGAVGLAVRSLLSEQRPALVYGRADFIGRDGRPLGPCRQVEAWDLHRLIHELDFVVQPASFFRRDAYLAAGGLDPDLHYCMDYDLWIRLGSRFPVSFLPKVLADVRVYANTKTASGGLPRMIEIEQMIRRHGRSSLPERFQGEMLRAALDALRAGVRRHRPAEVASAARYGLEYGARGLKRRIRGRGSEVSQARIERYLERSRRTGTSPLSPGPHSSVAIVVPCYGHASYLPSMFESLVRQTRPPEEAIFVVDGAMDDSEGTLRRLIERPDVAREGRFTILVNERNMGQAASINRGIARANTDLVMILNDDDYLMHDAVESMLTLFSAYPEVALIGGTSIHVDSDNELNALPKLRAEYAPEEVDTIEIRLPSDVRSYRRFIDLNMTHSGSCFTKSAWRAAGGYYADKRARIVPFSDRDFQLRVNALFPVAISPDAPFSFWRRGSSVDHGRNS